MAITTVSSHVVSVNAIQGTLIADNAITAVHIATNAVSGTLIADNAVTATHIAQNTITVTQIADDAIEAAKIADGVITTNHLNKAMISSQTEVTPVAGDFVLLGDTSDSNNLKKAPLTLLLNSNVDISTKLNLSGGTMTGALIVQSSSSGATADGGANDLVVENSGNSGISILSGASSSGSIYFGDSGSAYDGYINYAQNNQRMGFATAGTGRMYIDSSGKVGIGTSSPASKLHIKNTASEDTAIILENTNNAQNLNIDYYNNAGAVQSRINYAEGPAAWNFIPNTSNGNSALYIAYDGKIGIGTTSPNRTLNLHVAANDSNFTQFTNSTTGAVGTNGFLVGIGSAGNAELWNYEAQPIIFATSSTERARIDSSGKIILGDNASHTDDLLQIETPASGGGHGIQIRRNDSNNDQGIGRIMFGNNTDTDLATISAITDGSTDNARLVFYTQPNGGSSTERMRIHASGCVDIGAATDRSLGTNIGTLVVNGSAGGGLWLSPGNSSAMSSKIYAEANGSVGDLIINNGTGVGSGGIRFQTNAAQKMMLDSGGRLLINKTSSSLTFGKLQVEAGGEASGHGGIVFFGDSDVSVGSGNVIQVLWFYEDDDATGGVFTRYRDGNSIMGQVTCANGTQVSYGVSSDERLKENIVNASSQLDTIKNIKVREFDWKVNGYHEVGMIAQELHTVIPSVVQKGGDDINEEVWGVDYGKLTPYLVKAVQEQQTIIEDLKSRIETLEG